LKNHRHSTIGQPRIGGIRIPPGWPKSGKSLACRGCHAGHQSAWPGLLVKPKEQLCVTCHK
jgi:predicted CXXCH cytochrome family protein